MSEIPEKTVEWGESADRLLFTGSDGKKVWSQKENPFYAPQLKIALRNVGVIRPGSLDDYLARGGYEAWSATATRERRRPTAKRDKINTRMLFLVDFLPDKY